MRDFFRGWRRKVGVLTLVMALVFMAGWMRSKSVQDVTSIQSGRHTSEYLQSVNCVLVWQWSNFEDTEYMVTNPAWTTHKFHPETKWFDETGMVWRWQMCGFGFGELQSDLIEGVQEKYFFVPYWSIALPQTAISAFLLLTKPRQPNQKKITEPVANDGA